MPTQELAGTAAVTELRRPLAYESRGTEPIPASEQASTPWTFFCLMTGTSFNLGSIVYGWLPISLGLSLPGALTAIAAGTLVGMIPVTPLILIGSRTGTNNSTSSGAEYGVRGRLIGSGLGFCLTLVATAVGIWVCGGVLVALSARLLHTPAGNGALAASYAILTVLSIVIAVYGYHLLARAAWVLMIGGTLVTALMLAAFAGHLHPGYRGGPYALGSPGATWLLAALAAGTGSVMSQVTMFGDWTRYIPGRRYPPRRLLPPALLGVAIGYIVPVAIGALVTTAFASPAAPFPQSLVAAAPTWFAVALIPAALLGGLGWSASTIYSSGLDLAAVVARPAWRARATAITSIAGLGLVLAGSLAWDAAASLAAASVLLLALSAPWAAVVGVGYLWRKGRYLPDDLQLWNQRARDGAYWYSGGWNPAAVTAWAAGSAWGLLTVQTTLYTGPLAGIAGGVDLSFAGSAVIAGAIYALLSSLPRSRAGQGSPA
jgi:purine-cytosine permease-like protein